MLFAPTVRSLHSVRRQVGQRLQDSTEIAQNGWGRQDVESVQVKGADLGCRAWRFKRWGFEEIRQLLRKQALFLRFVDFPGVVQALRETAKKGRKRSKKADFP